MSSNKKYWKSVEELNENSSIVETLKQNEFAQEIPMDATTNGGANARVNASVLDLYDSMRMQGPVKGDTYVSWEDLNAEVTNKLTALSGSGKQIVLLTQTFASPSTTKLIAEFKQKYGNVNHVVYDAISESAALDAYQAKYNERGLANYDFSKADTIVSIGADFLSDWQGGGFDSGYAAGRVPTNGKMSRHNRNKQCSFTD